MADDDVRVTRNPQQRDGRVAIARGPMPQGKGA